MCNVGQATIIENFKLLNKQFYRGLMTFPAPFINRYISYPYHTPNHFWTYLNTPQLTTSPLINSYPNLHYMNTLAQIYSTIPNPSFNFQQPLPNAPTTIAQNGFQNDQKVVDLKKQERRLIQNNKIQKKCKEKKEPVLIEISDEDNHDQQEKKPECLTPPTIHTIEESITFKPKDLPLTKQKVQPAKRQDQTVSIKAEIKKQDNCKIDKKKKIVKPLAHNRNEKNKDHATGKQKRNIISERIAKKIQQQKGCYRLSKKQKNTLEITLLRETTNQILTGPQFQAKIPEFRLHNTDLIPKTKKIRQNLLSRLYQQSDDDDYND